MHDIAVSRRAWAQAVLQLGGLEPSVTAKVVQELRAVVGTLCVRLQLLPLRRVQRSDTVD